MTRSFTGSIPISEIVSLCDIARHAPSAGFSQGSHFLVLDGPELKRFWDITGAGGRFSDVNPGVLSASACVLVLGDRGAYLERYSQDDKAGHGLESAGGWPTPFWLTDAAMAAQNLLLLLEERRWGALYFGLFKDAHSRLSEFGVPKGVECVGVIAVGQRSPTDRPSGSALIRERRPTNEQVHIHSW